jgi:transcriptional regulator with XRE-family HTH domain
MYTSAYQIRLHRFLARKSQSDVAVVIGRSQGWVSQIERGYRKPTPEDITSIAGAIGVDPSVLVDGDQS